MLARCGSLAAINSACLAPLSSLAERDQLPHAIRRRCPLSKDVDVAVVGANLVGDGLWVVPLIEHSFDLILPFSEPEPNGSFIGLPARGEFHS